MEFKVLGPLEVRRDGEGVALGGAKPRALLAVLLLHGNEPVSAERLAGALWGEDAPPGAVRTVHVHVSRLRKALGDDEVLATTAAGYRLRVRPGELDLDRFERLLDEGRRALADGRPQNAGELLREALGLWRGPPLADLALEPFAAAEIARLEEQRLVAVEARIQADLAVGRDAELVAELQHLVGEHPLRERLHGQLMLALYRAGRQAEALQVYRQARRVLVDQLGLEPGPELRQLERAILAQEPPLSEAGLGGEADRPDADAQQVRQVPLPPTATIGRETELERLRSILHDGAARLVTVVGPPGVGKTRLAVELARTISPLPRDGPVFVSLAPLGSSTDVASTIARAVGVTPAPGESPENALIRDLGRRELLLVLDNFEHLLDAAPLVAELVASASALTVVATSREPLRVRAERLFHLTPLAVTVTEADAATSEPRPGPAVALFVAAARTRDCNFVLGEREVPVAVEICRRLDGLPLAIELAAGRVGLLTVTELGARLRAGLDALGAGPRDAPDRQRTLTSALEWSYALLNAREQSALLGLAVFAGGCTLDAAEAVIRLPLRVFESLVDKNLVQVEPGHNGHRRLVLLETVRTFALQRESGLKLRAIQQRHADYYLQQAQAARAQLEHTSSRAVLAELDPEVDNIRVAFAWALDHAPESALRLASAAARYRMLRAMSGETVSGVRAALARAGEDAPAAVRADALTEYSIALTLNGATADGERAAAESLRLHRRSGDLAGQARNLLALADVHHREHRFDAAHRLAREAERVADAAADTQARVWALDMMAMTAPTLADGLTFGQQAIAMHRSHGNQQYVAMLQSALAYNALCHEEHAAAERLSTEAVAAAAAHGDPFVLALAHGNAGLAALFTGRADRARTAFVRELHLAARARYDGGYIRMLFEGLIGLAAVAAADGLDATAATLNGAADSTTPERHNPVIARTLHERFLAPSRDRLGESRWETAYIAGTKLNRDDAIETALHSHTLRVVA